MEVYFVEQESEERYVKIGVSDNVQHRIGGLQNGSPYKINLILSFDTGEYDAKEVESWFHRMFSKAHVRGEWYKPSCYMYDVIGDVNKRGFLKATEFDFSSIGYIWTDDFSDAYQQIYRYARELIGYGHYEAFGSMVREIGELHNDLKEGSF